ncbi:tetratricopeptide repeat-containing sensor histidine kinase [Sinomicrobium sp. M5D2P9]
MMDLAGALNPSQDSIQVINYFNRALTIAKEKKDSILEAKLYANISRFYYYSYDLIRADIFIDQSEKILLGLDNKKSKSLLPVVMNMKSAYLGAQGKTQEQQDYYFKIIPTFESLSDSRNLSAVYSGLGVIYFNKGENNNAKKYFEKSINTYLNTDPTSATYAAQYLDLTTVNIELNNIPEAKDYLQKAKKLLFSISDDILQKGEYYTLKGRIEMNEKKYKKGIVSLKKGMEISRKFGNIHGISNNLQSLSDIYIEHKDFRAAYAVLKEYDEITKELDDKSLNYNALKDLADVEFKLGKTSEAYKHLRQALQLSDSLNDTAVKEKLFELEKQFESEKKEKEIAQLQYQNEKKEWKLQQNKIWLFGSTAAILVLFVLAFLLYRNSKNQKRINRQEKDLHYYELSQLEQKHQIEILSSLMQGAETERQRLGRDLHDGLGGLFSGIKLKLNAYFQSPSHKNKELQSELRSDLDHAITEMRVISQSLLPDLLHKFGLLEAIKQYCSRLSCTDVTIGFRTVNFQERSGMEKQLMVYRIVQELINNAVKHADAKEIFVQLQQRENQLFLTVEDDGVGFDEKEGLQKGSGLTNLKNRVDYLKGTIEISSTKGKGSSFYITCPI